MSNLSQFLGGSGAPIGTIVAGNISPGGDWLPLDDTVYNKADYPLLDTSKMLTFDGQSFTTGPTFAAAQYRVISCGGNVWYAYQVSGTNCRRSTDNGVTWTSGTLPATFSPGGFGVFYTGGLFFMMPTGSTFGGNYWTSTDGLAWTSRAAINSIASFGPIVYIAGRYVAIPCVAGPSGGGFAYYSATGTGGWIAIHQLVGANQSSAFYGVEQAVVQVSPRVGILVPVTSSLYTYMTTDGLTWTSANINQDYAESTTGTATAPLKVDAFGNIHDASLVIGSNTSWGARRSTKIVSTFPLYASNLFIYASGTHISENHGLSFHVSGVPCYTMYGADFNGSRLVVCSAAGGISYMDVSPTKFRAALLPMESSEMVNSTLYMKAR